MYSNQNIYLFAKPVAGVVFEDVKHHLFTSIRFQPYHTAALYDENVLFCGDVSKEFNGKNGPVIVTYDRVAHQSTKGIGCHDLWSVFEVTTLPKETK